MNPKAGTKTSEFAIVAICIAAVVLDGLSTSPTGGFSYNLNPDYVPWLMGLAGAYATVRGGVKAFPPKPKPTMPPVTE